MAIKRRCRFCGTSINGRSDKIYCSAACRFRDWKDATEGTSHPTIQPCEYCGMPADSLDHVPPQAVRPFLAESGLTGRYPFVEVWSCRECNCLLGARALFTIRSRADFIKKALAKRYAKFLRTPEWTDAELAKLGYVLQQIVINALVMKELVKSRIRWKN